MWDRPKQKLCGQNVELLTVPKLVVCRGTTGILIIIAEKFVLFFRHYIKSTFRIEERPKIFPMFTLSFVISSVSSKYSYIKAACDHHCYECLLQWKSNKHFIFWVVSVALVIQKANCMRRNIICGLLNFTIFFPYYRINGKIFEKKKSTWNVCFFSTTFVQKHSLF